ncbi:MAG: hypothetical protein WBX00_17935 [Isosphaeraceae bacterium]
MSPDRKLVGALRFVSTDHRFAPFVARQCNGQCNGRRAISACNRCLDALPVGVGVLAQGQRRKSIKSPVDIEKAGVGVDVGGQARVRVSHGGLSGSQGHSAPAQECAKGRSKCMHVERPAPVVSLLDLGGFQVAVEDADQSAWHLEDRGITGQPRRNRLAPVQCFRLERGELFGEPVLQVFRQVVADDHAVAFAVLFVLGVKLDVRDRTIEP